MAGAVPEMSRANLRNAATDTARDHRQTRCVFVGNRSSNGEENRAMGDASNRSHRATAGSLFAGADDQLRLILFDCDGTLVDSQHAIVDAMTQAFQGVDRPVPSRDVMLEQVGLTLEHGLRAMVADACEDQIAQMATIYRATYCAVRQSKREGHEPLYSGIAPLLRELAAAPNFLLGTATGKSWRGVNHMVAAHGLDGLFATLQTADDNPSKPHPGMVLRAMAETGTSPAQVIVVGDTQFDLQMARAAGVAAIGVTWGYHDAHRLKAAAPVDVVETVAQLRDALASWSRTPARLSAAE